MAKKPPPPPEAEKENSERWLLTYADLITLLLVFFIILYVFSIQDVVKFQSMAESLNGALSGTKYLVGGAPGPSFIDGHSGLKVKVKQAKTTERAKMEELKKRIEAMAKAQGLESAISVTLEERGVVIHIVDQILFNSGYANLTGQAFEVLQGIGRILLSNTDQYIRIEGHTDNIPIANSQFPSNWELSASRATNVLRMFIDDVGIDPRLLSAVGYGEFRPMADNFTEEGRAKNRRVEVVVLSNKFQKSESQSQNLGIGSEIGAGE